MTLSHRVITHLVVPLLLVFLCAVHVSAGETSLYLKSGWFTWEERLNGDFFVKEKGLLHGLGLQHEDRFVQMLELGELVEVWGGTIDYDGHDVTGSSDMKGDTSYVGTREEIAGGVLLPLGRSVVVKPYGAVGHRFWIRTRSSEDWNIFFGRAGLGAEVRRPWGVLFARGGAFIPFYLRNHVRLHEVGYEDVSVWPDGRVSPFAEGGVRVGAWAVGIEYETLRLGVSPMVATRRIGVGATGAAVVNNLAFQPASDSTLVSLKISYLF